MTCPKCKHQNTKLHGFYGKKRTERYRCIDCSSTFTANNHKLISSMHITREKQNMILDMLVEGMSIRSISRLTGVEKKTISRLLVMAGDKCANLMKNTMKDLQCKEVQCDEIWTFVHTKKERLAKRDVTKGDQYIFVALDANTKLIPTFYVGKRDTVSTFKFMQDLRKRVVNKFQLTTDGFKPYLEAVEKYFGMDVDYAQLVKQYNGENVVESKRRYAPADFIGSLLKKITGEPKVSKISTSHVERQNLTMRMNMRRLTRLTNGFSKKLENLKAMLAIYFVHYNFIRIHSSLRMPPAMKAGLVNTLWTWDNVFQTS